VGDDPDGGAHVVDEGNVPSKVAPGSGARPDDRGGRTDYQRGDRQPRRDAQLVAGQEAASQAGSPWRPPQHTLRKEGAIGKVHRHRSRRSAREHFGEAFHCRTDKADERSGNDADEQREAHQHRDGRGLPGVRILEARAEFTGRTGKQPLKTRAASLRR
jgi:hypothetical protein